VDQLLETITVMAELLELEADPDASLEAVVIESTKDQYRGPIATAIVQQGTMQVRQELYSLETDGRIKSLTDDRGEQLDEVGPGDPVEIMGLNDVPTVGTILRDADAEYEEELEAEVEDTGDENPFADLDIAAAFGEKEMLKVVLRSDVKGTLEAVQENLQHDNIEIVDAAVGSVSDRDLEIAETSDAIILAFHTKVPGRVKKQAKQQGIVIRQYKVIYKLIEDLEEQIEKLIDPTAGQTVTGVAEILEIFDLSGTLVAGSRVKTGEINQTDNINLRRDGEIIATPTISSLQRGQEKVDRVTAKSEFGATFRGNVDFQVGDVIEAYEE
jgi:translation initiation factor IF-2